MIFSGFTLVLSLWNYNYFDDHLVSRLYKIERSTCTLSIEADKQTDVGCLEEMSTHRLDNPKAYIRDLLPTCLSRISTCCQPDRRTRAFIIARTKLSHETNAFEFIRHKRYVNSAL